MGPNETMIGCIGLGPVLLLWHSAVSCTLLFWRFVAKGLLANGENTNTWHVCNKSTTNGNAWPCALQIKEETSAEYVREIVNTVLAIMITVLSILLHLITVCDSFRAVGAGKMDYKVDFKRCAICGVNRSPLYVCTMGSHFSNMASSGLRFVRATFWWQNECVGGKKDIDIKQVY